MLLPNNVVVKTRHIEIIRHEAPRGTFYNLNVYDDNGRLLGWSKFYDLEKAYRQATIHIKELNRYGKTH